MGNKKYPKIMFHCVNGTGLGHITRALNISKILLENKAASDILIESDGKYIPKNIPKKVKFKNLKYMNHQIYKNPKLRIKQESIVKKMIQNFKPNFFVVDNETPLFIKNKELPQTKKIFMLRSVKEDFLNQNINLLKGCYDKIIIPHTKKEFDFLYSEKTLNRLKSKKIIFVGPIIRNWITKSVKQKYDFLATIGGGGLHHNPKKPGTFFKTSEKNLEIICKTFLNLKEENSKLKLAILCGQNFPKNSYKKLIKKYDAGINVFYSSENPLKLYKSTKILISQLGYNTTFEAIKYKIPTIFFMKKSIPESQYLRGRWIEKNKIGVFISNLNKDSLLKELKNLSNKEIQKLKNNLNKFKLESNHKNLIKVFKNENR